MPSPASPIPGRTVPGPGHTAVRLPWARVPLALRSYLADRLGAAITAAHVQGGGFTPGVAARLELAARPGRPADRVFVKAIPETHPLAGKYHTEAATAARLPRSAPTPRLRWHAVSAGWVILCFDDVAGTTPDLSPGSADIGLVAGAVSRLIEVLTPAPFSGPPASATARGDWLHGWGELAAAPPADLGPWERDRLELLAGLERQWLPHAGGTTLVHGDIRPDNMIITAGGGPPGVVVVDWAQPSIGAAWQDAADLVPHLIMAGHTPGAAQAALDRIGAWGDAPEGALTAYAASYAGYWARACRLPDPPGVPHLRGYQRAASRAALAWTRHRLGLGPAVR